MCNIGSDCKGQNPRYLIKHVKSFIDIKEQLTSHNDLWNDYKMKMVITNAEPTGSTKNVLSQNTTSAYVFPDINVEYFKFCHLPLKLARIAKYLLRSKIYTLSNKLYRI